MSIEMDKHVGLVGVWTVGTKGDVLYRHGVTRECPQVRGIAFMYVKFVWLPEIPEFCPLILGYMNVYHFLQ